MLILSRRPGESLRIEPDRTAATGTDPFGWFAEGPIRVSIRSVHRNLVRIGIAAPPAFAILRDELADRSRACAPVAIPAREVLARKVEFLRFSRNWSIEDLAAATALPVSTILGIESGAGSVELGELETLAYAFGITLVALLLPGRTATEPVVST